jgi:hypothetical protein
LASTGASREDPKNETLASQKIRFNRFSEDALFDGRTKYEEPQAPYHYDYKYKEVDTSLPVYEWIYIWFKNS